MFPSSPTLHSSLHNIDTHKFLIYFFNSAISILCLIITFIIVTVNGYKILYPVTWIYYPVISDTLLQKTSLHANFSNFKILSLKQISRHVIIHKKYYLIIL